MSEPNTVILDLDADGNLVDRATGQIVPPPEPLPIPEDIVPPWLINPSTPQVLSMSEVAPTAVPEVTPEEVVPEEVTPEVTPEETPQEGTPE